MEGPWVKSDVRRVLAAERWLERRRRRERWRDSRMASEGEMGSRMLDMSLERGWDAQGLGSLRYSEVV